MRPPRARLFSTLGGYAMNPFATAALLMIAIAQISMAYMAIQPTPEQVHLSSAATALQGAGEERYGCRCLFCLCEQVKQVGWSALAFITIWAIWSPL